LDETEFVERLYITLLVRTPSSDEMTWWVSQIRGGTSRYNVFVNFVHSAEFGNVCATHNITRGTAPLPKNTMREDGTTLAKIWNLIVNANVSGISDRPEHIAGIIGNMQAEAGFRLCPFQVQTSNQVGLGLMQWSFGRRTELENFMFTRGVSRDDFYREESKHRDHNGNHILCWGVYQHSTWYQDGNGDWQVDTRLYDRVLELQIAFMAHEFRNTSEREYMSYVDFPTVRTGTAGARAYAELFCSVALRPGAGGPDDNIQDLGVQNALRASPYAGGRGALSTISFSALNNRRNNAETAFREFQRNHR
jgi:hypothetical protein